MQNVQNKDACFERKLVGNFSPFQGQKRHLSESAAKVYGKVAKSRLLPGRILPGSLLLLLLLILLIGGFFDWFSAFSSSLPF